MYLKNIDLHNFKTIVNFRKEFSGGIYLVTGENEIGKSTLISAIVTLLDGNRSNNLLKEGMERGHAKATFGDESREYDVELKFTKANPRGTLKITTPDGMSSNNKSVLEKIFQYQDFDANEFVSWSQTEAGRRKQVALVKSLLPEATQKKIDETETLIETKKNERKEVNAELKQAEAVTKKTEVPAEWLEEYKEEKDVLELYEQKGNATAINEKREEREHELMVLESQIETFPEDTAEKVQSFDLQIEDLERKIKQAKEQKESLIKNRKKQLQEIKEVKKEKADWLKANPKVEIEEIQKEIAEAQQHNERTKLTSDYKEASLELEKVNAKKETFDSEIEALNNERKELIENSNIPIEGLTFTEEGLFLNGIPFAPGEVSTSQEMEVAVKLIIAKNPTTKVFKIAQGESLGEKKLKAIVEFAKQNNYQGFIEEVHRGQDNLIVEEYKEV